MYPNVCATGLPGKGQASAGQPRRRRQHTRRPPSPLFGRPGPRAQARRRQRTLRGQAARRKNSTRSLEYASTCYFCGRGCAHQSSRSRSTGVDSGSRHRFLRPNVRPDPMPSLPALTAPRAQDSRAPKIAWRRGPRTRSRLSRWRPVPPQRCHPRLATVHTH
eukprot:scaffold12181_cov213-Isochrysis_galbana.AAC.4